MKILRAFKTELDLNNKQCTILAKHEFTDARSGLSAGTARFAYNWGLARKIETFKSGQKVPTAIDLHRELNALKKTDFPWMYSPREIVRMECEHYFPSALSHGVKCPSVRLKKHCEIWTKRS